MHRQTTFFKPRQLDVGQNWMAVMFFKAISMTARMGFAEPSVRQVNPSSLDPEILNTSLALALDTSVTNQPDFIWVLDQTTGIMTIHHPDPGVQASMNHPQLIGVLTEIISRAKPYTAASILVHAIQNRYRITNVEVEWRKAGASNWWQISAAPSCEYGFADDKMVGIVRDITAAQNFCAQLIDGEVRYNDLREANTRLGSVLASCLRQHINLIANVTNDRLNYSPDEENHPLLEQHDFTSQIRSSIDELLMIASLVRDYADAISGELKIIKQETMFAEIASFVVQGLAARIERFGVKLDISRHMDITPINADLDRLRKLVHIIANQTASLATPGSRLKLDISTSQNAELLIKISYCGQDPANFKNLNTAILNGDMLHPVLAHEFIEQVLQAHHAKLDFTRSSAAEHRAILRLPSLA